MSEQPRSGEMFIVNGVKKSPSSVGAEHSVAHKWAQYFKMRRGV